MARGFAKKLIMKFKSKLPKTIKDSLAKEMKILFTGKVENIKVNINLTLPVKVGYGWGENASAQYNMQPQNYESSFHHMVYSSIRHSMQPKIDKANAKIKKFYHRLDKVCKKHNTDPEAEFDHIYNKYKLQNCSDNWH